MTDLPEVITYLLDWEKRVTEKENPSNNEIKTSVIVRDRQSAAVGGLITNSSSTGYNKSPNETQNPLFNLQAARGTQRQQSQFVIFVTPVIKSSASAGSEQVKKKFRLRD